MMPPMLEKPGRLRRDQPLVGVRKIAPGFDVGPNFVDNRRWIVFLFLGRKVIVAAEYKLTLRLVLPPFFGLWNRRDQVRPSAVRYNLVGWLPIIVQLPVARRAGVR
jgi:hypothetical protein